MDNILQELYEANYENFDLYVTIKCNKCGSVAGFYPHRVIYLECSCGNSDYGSPLTDWPKGLFGYHTLVEASIWHLPTLSEMVEDLFAERLKDNS
jgi:hypothetical protein